ncbi:MAG: helix-turn-helix transcriptional regulator [Myxococcales bacterium]|nr:helix-turn-helix transcriptional regulator [Myxococcales bacterium]
MDHNPDRNEPEQVTFSRRRFHAARELRGLSMEGMARQCEVSARHLWYVVTRERKPSLAMLAKLRAQLGEPGWLFATGQADALRDDAAGTAAASASEGSPCR